MLVSFIVVTFNEAKALPLVHRAIRALRLPEGFDIETVAVDGGSRDGTPAVARQCGFTTVIELPGASIPACRNAGMHHAKGGWLAFVDADCVLEEHWLTHAASLLFAHPKLILGWPASPPEPGTWVQRAWHAHWMTKNPKLEKEQGELVVKSGGFRMITTRNMIMPRSVAEDVGGFDEALSTGEDTDYVFRATMSGIPAWGLPSLKSVHLGEPDTLKKFFRQQLWHANRKAYKTIMARSGMKAGGNAPMFTALFLVLLVMAVAGLAASVWHPLFLTGVAPLIVLLSLIAARTCWRSRDPRLFLPLAVLYGAYGLARAIDLCGLAPHKPSWKTQPQTQAL